MPETPMISIVDDDFSIRKATMSLIRARSFAGQAFEIPENTLKSGGLLMACSVTAETPMRVMSRLELQNPPVAGTATPWYCSSH
jgi:FixJ family two-component response regulator